MCRYLSELAYIANSFSLESLEIGSNTAVLEVHNACERLIEKGTNRQDRKVSGFGLRRNF